MPQLRNYFTCLLNTTHTRVITNIILFCRNHCVGMNVIYVACNPFRISCRNNRRIRDTVSPGISLPETSAARTDEPLARTRYYLSDKVSAGTDEQILPIKICDNDLDRGVTPARLKNRNQISALALLVGY